MYKHHCCLILSKKKKTFLTASSSGISLTIASHFLISCPQTMATILTISQKQTLTIRSLADLPCYPVSA